MAKLCMVSKRQMVVDAVAHPLYHLISIRTPGRDYYNTVNLAGWMSAPLVLEFDDVTESGSVPDTEVHSTWAQDFMSTNIFDDNHAQQIIDFVEPIAEADQSIWVHCDAGLSRSVAVGRFLTTFYDYDTLYATAGHDQFANIHIYNTLSRRFRDLNQEAGILHK